MAGAAAGGIAAARRDALRQRGAGVAGRGHGHVSAQDIALPCFWVGRMRVISSAIEMTAASASQHDCLTPIPILCVPSRSLPLPFPQPHPRPWRRAAEHPPAGGGGGGGAHRARVAGGRLASHGPAARGAAVAPGTPLHAPVRLPQPGGRGALRQPPVRQPERAAQLCALAGGDARPAGRCRFVVLGGTWLGVG